MVKVKKRDGRFEEFDESKIVKEVKKVGVTIEEAEQIAKSIVEKSMQNVDDVLKIPEITAEELSKKVEAELRETNETAAKEFVKFRENKLKNKEKDSAKQTSKDKLVAD